jgi:hypothetical protein
MTATRIFGETDTRRVHGLATAFGKNAIAGQRRFTPLDQDFQARSGVLGGIRTPNLLIRSSGRALDTRWHEWPEGAGIA